MRSVILPFFFPLPSMAPSIFVNEGDRSVTVTTGDDRRRAGSALLRAQKLQDGK